MHTKILSPILVCISFFTHVFATPYIFKKPAKNNGANTRKKCVKMQTHLQSMTFVLPRRVNTEAAASSATVELLGRLIRKVLQVLCRRWCRRVAQRQMRMRFVSFWSAFSASAPSSPGIIGGGHEGEGSESTAQVLNNSSGNISRGLSEGNSPG